MREGRSGSDHRNVLIQPTQHPSPHRLLHCGEILWPQRGRQTRNTVSLLEVGLVPNVLRSSLECGLEHRIGPLTRIFHQDAELWRRTRRDRFGSTAATHRSFYWQDGHARYGRPEPARIRVTPNPIWVQTKRPWIACTDAPASKRGWPGEISGLSLSKVLIE